jgi:hypothetical protein
MSWWFEQERGGDSVDREEIYCFTRRLFALGFLRRVSETP